MPARLLVVQHEDDCPPAWFGEWFAASGLELDVRLGHRGDTIPGQLDEHDALVVLGGEMGAYDDAQNPWLTPTKALISRTVAAGLPFLGICLGHQLAAVALGGEVVVNPQGQATGLTPVWLTEAGEADPLVGVIRPAAHSVQWNRDVVSRLPAGAQTLALAPDGTVQAARFGPQAWGVQFHPEASPAVFESWIATASPAAALALRAALVDISAAERELRADWETLATRFADIVLAGGSAAQHLDAVEHSAS